MTRTILAVETTGREVFLGFDTAGKLIFYVLSTIAIALFLWGFYQRIRKYRRGRPAARLDFGRFVRALGDIASNRTIAKRNRLVGVAHFFVLWGFVVLLIGTTIIAIDEDVIGLALDKPSWQFWRGGFYIAYALLLDVFGIGFVAGEATTGAGRGSTMAVSLPFSSSSSAWIHAQSGPKYSPSSHL